MSPVVTNFVQVDSMTHKIEMNNHFNVSYRQILEILHRNVINMTKALVLGDYRSIIYNVTNDAEQQLADKMI